MGHLAEGIHRGFEGLHLVGKALDLGGVHRLLLVVVLVLGLLALVFFRLILGGLSLGLFFLGVLGSLFLGRLLGFCLLGRILGLAGLDPVERGPEAVLAFLQFVLGLLEAVFQFFVGHNRLLRVIERQIEMIERHVVIQDRDV